MPKILAVPNRYIQGYGIMKDFGKYVAHLGSKPFIIGGKTALSVIREGVLKSMAESSMQCEFAIFSGKGTRAEAADLAKKATRFEADMIAGAGGGHVLDTAKAVAFELDLPVVMVPTVVASDAPCSAGAQQYTEDHQLDRIVRLKRNPDVIIVDSKIVAEAPTRFFVAGMGDTLSTWFEAQTCMKSSVKNFHGGMATAAAVAIARLAYDTLFEFGVAAKLAVDQNAVTPAVERVIEANALLSSVGFENTGLAVAHSIAIGLETLQGAGNCLHGELVGFGTIANLVLENYPKEEITKVIGFCGAVGLPLTLKQLGILDTSRSNLMKAAEVACSPGLFIRNLSLEITPDLVADSIIGTNALGTSYGTMNVKR